MQNVFFLSSVTYEWIQVTPSSAFRSTTCRHVAAPAAVTGIDSPSGNVLSTRYLGMNAPPIALGYASSLQANIGTARRHRIGNCAQFGRARLPSCIAGQPLTDNLAHGASGRAGIHKLERC